MYNAGKGQDFFAVELVNGHIHYVLNLGYGIIAIKDNSPKSLSDNQWHSVSIGRPTREKHTLMVDEHLAVAKSTGENIYLDLDGILFLGMFKLWNIAKIYIFMTMQVPTKINIYIWLLICTCVNLRL